MRILVLSNIGLGLYKFRRELLAELVKENEVFFCIPNDDYIKPIEELGCSFVDNPYLDRHGTNPIKELKLLHFYKGIMRKLKPDVVLTYTIKPNVYGGIACASLQIPYIVNVTGLGTSIENGGIMQKISLFLYKYGIRKAQKVYFQNIDNQDLFVRKNIINGRYDLLPGSGVNLSKFELSSYPTGETVDFVFVARIMKEKGIDQYFDAALSIRKEHPETRFHICGFCEQDYRADLDKLQKEGIIIYHGLVHDMIPIYRMVACVVHPTYYPEGLSNVLLEACAIGRPIITTDRSGCSEVVEDGVNGYVVRQKDSSDLIDKIELFLSLSHEERKRMGVAGRRKVEKEFDRKNVVRSYMEEIKNVHEMKRRYYNE